MKVWLLTAIQTSQPWQNVHLEDTQTQCVVVAETEARARQLAAMHSGEEGFDAWVVPGCVRVEELTARKAEGMGMTDNV